MFEHTEMQYGEDTGLRSASGKPLHIGDKVTFTVYHGTEQVFTTGYVVSGPGWMPLGAVGPGESYRCAWVGVDDPDSEGTVGVATLHPSWGSYVPLVKRAGSVDHADPHAREHRERHQQLVTRLRNAIQAAGLKDCLAVTAAGDFFHRKGSDPEVYSPLRTPLAASKDLNKLEHLVQWFEAAACRGT